MGRSRSGLIIGFGYWYVRTYNRISEIAHSSTVFLRTELESLDFPYCLKSNQIITPGIYLPAYHILAQSFISQYQFPTLFALSFNLLVGTGTWYLV